MSTETLIEAANQRMAAIAAVDAPVHERRERLREVWQPIIQALVDVSRPPPEGQEWDPNYVGFTSDTQRPVFLVKETAPTGFVYRKFHVRRH